MLRDGVEAIASTMRALVSLQGGPQDLIHGKDEQHVSMMIDNETKKRSTLDCEILQKVGNEEEDGGVAPTSPYHSTSTQQLEMYLRSGSSHIMFQSVVHMGMSHKTSLSCGVPLGDHLIQI